MAILLVNHTATIEINYNVNLQHIIGKGSFDVTISTGKDAAGATVDFVWILFFKREGQIKDNVSLDWREITPSVASAEALKDLILGWNIAPVVVTEGVELQDENGTSYGVKHVDNKPRVSSMPYSYDIAEGNVSGHNSVRRFGHNPDVSTSWETLSHKSSIYAYLTSAEVLKIKSDNVNDASGGTGARTILISGYDGDYAIQSETVTLNGTTAVDTANSYLRIMKMRVKTVGTGATNAGEITCNNNAESNELLQIEPEMGASTFIGWTVPAGQTFYMTSWDASEASSKGSKISMWKREFSSGVWEIMRMQQLLDSNFYIYFDFPLPFTEKTDIELRAKGVLAGADVSGGFSGWRE